MIWFPFYSSDFIGKTIGLSCQEVALYNWMLTLYYEVGPFPEERTRCYRIVRCESDEQKRTVDFILGQFFVLKDGQWWNERAEHVKEAITRHQDQARERGKLSAQARLTKYGTAQPQARKPFESLSKASGKAPELSTSTSTSITKDTTKTIAGQDLPLSEIPKTEGEKPLRASRAALSAPPDVSEQVWTDFLQTRKTLKAAVTATAVAGIAREAAKADMTLEDALRMCCARGWRGFKAEWVAGQSGAQKSGSEGQAERVAKLFFGDRAKEVLNGRE
jgi:uncharacterized protein YdaU (DUF1376 family)